MDTCQRDILETGQRVALGLPDHVYLKEYVPGYKMYKLLCQSHNQIMLFQWVLSLLLLETDCSCTGTHCPVYIDALLIIC